MTDLTTTIRWAEIHNTLDRGQAERDLQWVICPDCDHRIVCPGIGDPNCEITEFLAATR